MPDDHIIDNEIYIWEDKFFKSLYQNIIKSDRTGYLSTVAGATGFLDPGTLDDALARKWPEAEAEFLRLMLP